MSDLQFIKATESRRPGQIAEVYLWGGQQHLWISTVTDRFVAISGEETIAFLCDADGNVEDWGSVVMAVGPDSREDVFEQLREGEPE